MEDRPPAGLIIDDLLSRMVAGVCEAIEARSATQLYLPPYRPDLNPIELVFSKLKALLRAAAIRTVDALRTKLGTLLDQFYPAEGARYLPHCGYA